MCERKNISITSYPTLDGVYNFWYFVDLAVQGDVETNQIDALFTKEVRMDALESLKC